MSGKDIIIGAKKGVITLRHTYNLNVTSFSRGILQFQKNNIIRSRLSDCLQIDDLVSLAEMSFTLFNWYDSGLLFLREALFNVKTHLTRKENISSLDIGTIMNELKSKYVDLHNTLLLNKNTNIGPDWKLFPVFVDEGYLQSDNNIQMLYSQYNVGNQIYRVIRVMFFGLIM